MFPIGATIGGKAASIQGHVDPDAYALWQVINTAQGKGGSGGRIEALQELNKDNISLVGVNADAAFLKGVDLKGARLSRCSMQSSDLRNSHLDFSDMTFCNLRSSNFREATLEHIQMMDANLTDADFTESDLAGADLTRTDLSRADLRYADLSQFRWRKIALVRFANLWGVRNPPEGFLSFALSHGAVSLSSDDDWAKVLDENP